MRYLSPLARLLENASDELIGAQRSIAWARVAVAGARAARSRRGTCPGRPKTIAQDILMRGACKA